MLRNDVGRHRRINFVCSLLSLFYKLVPGPPFVFGALMVLGALVVAMFIPEGPPQSGHSLQDVAGPSHHEGPRASLTSTSHKEHYHKESHSRRYQKQSYQ